MGSWPAASITFQPPWCWATSGVGFGLNALAVLHSLHHCRCVCLGCLWVSVFHFMSACLFTSACLGGLSAIGSWGTVRTKGLSPRSPLQESWGICIMSINLHVIYMCVYVYIYGPSLLAKAGYTRLIPGLEKSPGGRNGTPVSLPGESHGAWWAIVCRASQHTHTHTHTHTWGSLCCSLSGSVQVSDQVWREQPSAG